MHLTAETPPAADTIQPRSDLLPLLRHQEVGPWEFGLFWKPLVLPASNRGHGMHLTAETPPAADTIQPRADLLPLLRHQEVGPWEFGLFWKPLVLPASNRGHGMHLTAETPPAADTIQPRADLLPLLRHQEVRRLGMSLACSRSQP